VSDSGVIDKYGCFNNYGDCITPVINQNEFSELIRLNRPNSGLFIDIPQLLVF